MSSYEVIKDYSSSSNNGFVTINPYALVAVYRYEYPVTFSRSDPTINVNSLDKATTLRKTPYIITNDIINIQVANNKENHVTSMSMSLRNGTNYLSELLPGDHVFVWMFQDKNTFEAVLEKVKNGEAANRFLDGLKFWGKINSCRKSIFQNPQGLRQTSYSVSGAGFTELDASIYYEPKLAGANLGEISSWLHKTGIGINNIIGQDSQGGIALNSVVPALFKALLGAGFPKNASIQSDALDTTAGLDTSTSFLVPQEVAKVFGVDGGKIRITDIYQLIHGIQKYSGGDINANDYYTETEDGANLKVGAVFNPDGVYPYSGNIIFTGTNQLGTFQPQVPAFNGQKTAWSILHQFLNRTINELYTTLRVNAKGFIVPTIVCRQLPFSSGVTSGVYKPKQQPSSINGGNFVNVNSANNASHSKAKSKIAGLDTPRLGAPEEDSPPPQSITLNLTRMTELPRWIIHPVLMKGFEVGRSDALRFNFIQIAGTDGQTTTNLTDQLVRNPPIKDELDMSRNGLRPYFDTVNCAPKDIHQQHGSMVGSWQYVLADILMGQHLTLTGSLTTYGIIQPICVGDNLEIDQTLFHIESVNHTFSDDGRGHKTFTTNFSLTHGVSAVQSVGDDASLYVGIRPEDINTYPAAVDQMSTIEQPDAGPGFEKNERKPEFLQGAVPKSPGNFENQDDQDIHSW
jgi:hypothetical protein